MEGAPFPGAEVEAILGVIDVAVLVNEHNYTDLTLDWDKMHSLNVPLQEPGILEP